MIFLESYDLGITIKTSVISIIKCLKTKLYEKIFNHISLSRLNIFKEIFPAALGQIKVSTKVQKNLARKLMKQTSLGQFEPGDYLR